MKVPNQKEDRGAVVIVVVDERTGRFALVIDRQKPEPHFWKFPGGKIDPEDVDVDHKYDDRLAARNAARRETTEETGLALRMENLIELTPIDRRTHRLYPFIGLANFEELAATGDEGETVKAFSLEQIQGHPHFFPNHKPILEEALKLIRG